MQVRSLLVREASDRLARSDPLLVKARPRGRPERTYELRLDRPADVRAARRLGLPLYLLTEPLLAALGFPMALPATLVAWRPLLDSITTRWRTHGVLAIERALSPRIEDVVAVLLKIDPLAARAILLRNPEFVDQDRLLRAVIEERVEREATAVRLQERAPAIPCVGKPLPLAALHRQDENARSFGLL